MRRLPLLLALCLLLSACSQEAMIHRFATPEADAFARDFIQQVRNGDPMAARKLSPELLQVPAMKDSLRSLTRVFPRGSVQEVKLLNAQVMTMSTGLTTRTLVYEEHSAGGWALVQVVVLEDAMKYRYINGMHVQPTRGAIQEMNAFTLAGKGALHWGMLLMATAVPLFCLGSAILVFRTPMRRRWAWALLALVGGFTATLNWTTGELFTRMFNVQLLGAGALQSGLGAPWLISVSLPVGALIALSRRRRFLADQNPDESIPMEPGVG